MSSKVEKRRNELLSIVNIDGKAFISEAAKLFNVTNETIRNDFDYLVKTHGLKRIHGGIEKNIESAYQPSYEYHKKKAINVEEKKRICYKMTDVIQDGDCIYVDGGSTVTYLLNYIGKRHNVTLFTPSIALLMKYMMEDLDETFKSNGNEMIFIGGKLNTNMQTTYGPFFDQTVSDINFDKMIISCDAIDIKDGITNADEIAYDIVRKVDRQAKNKYLLVDASKFGKRSKYRALPFNSIDYMISDIEPNIHWIKKISEESISFIQA